MSEYLCHLVNTTNRIEGACREIRECASQLAVENSNSTQQLKAEMAALVTSYDALPDNANLAKWCRDNMERIKRQLSAF